MQTILLETILLIFIIRRAVVVTAKENRTNACAFKKCDCNESLHITMKPDYSYGNQPYCIDIHQLIASIRLALNPQDSWVIVSNFALVIITRFVLCFLIKTFHAFHRNTFEYFSAQNSPGSLKLVSITLCWFIYLQHKFQLKTVSLVAAEILTYKTYQLFFPYIL